MGQVVSVNGFEMYYELEGTGEALVLLPGFSGSSGDWSYIGADLGAGFRRIKPDPRGHGRSTNPSGSWTFRQAALDTFALLDHLGIVKFKAIGISGGGNTLLHMATQQHHRVEAMILVSATPYFPEQARKAMRAFSLAGLSADEQKRMRDRCVHGEAQVETLINNTHGFASTYDDLNFTPPLLSTIQARTLIVHGDRDFLYPVEIATEMYQAIPNAQLWVVPNGSHGPVFGASAPDFIKTSAKFLRGLNYRVPGSTIISLVMSALTSMVLRSWSVAAS